MNKRYYVKCSCNSSNNRASRCGNRTRSRCNPSEGRNFNYTNDLNYLSYLHYLNNPNLNYLNNPSLVNNSGVNIIDFAYDTLKPQNMERHSDKIRQLLKEDEQHEVATIMLDAVNPGDIVWLQGVIGLENGGKDPEADVYIKIYKGNEEIYNSDHDIDVTNDEVVAPLSHVDIISESESNVNYTVTVTPEDPDLYLIGPVTFTGMQMRKG